jgi:hypothetical protein
MKRKTLKILGVILALIVLSGLAFLLWVNHAIETGKLVKWEGQWYYEEELKEKFPPQEYSVEAKNTPEEVYQKFRQALLEGEKEKALEYIVDEKREEYKQAFEDEESFSKYKMLPDVENLNKREKDSYGNFSNFYYYLSEDDEMPYDISFLKNKDGYWKIKSI